ncbi:MAG: DUF6434 domain-containing protein [Bacteroidota bacterium]
MHADFDWHGAELTAETKLTDNYKTTQNVRRFFKKHCGEDFHFSRECMNWLKTHPGKTLGDAIAQWNSQQRTF